jgi:SAM-dependent methyltransferase
VGEKIGRHALIPFTLFRCSHCLFAFIDPPWSGLSRAYDEQYYRGAGADPSVDYLFELEAPHKTIRFYEWKGFAEMIGALVPLTPKTRWLDYGCGNGGLVRHLRANGQADAVGYDRGWIVGQSRRHGIPLLSEREFARCAGRFDVVTMLEVIEHVTDPLAVLRDVRRLLKPGGILYLTTGNARPYHANLLRWRYILPEIHISFFEPSTLEAALKLAGFEPRYQLRPPGYTDVVRFKTLKNIGVRRRNLLERAVPWSLVSYFADRRYQVTYHPYGVASPDAQPCS